MNLLRDNNIQLNICPTSNVALMRVESIHHHPIAEIVRHGIPVTINSDDITIFDQSASEEYLLLAKHEILTFEELNFVRETGLNLKSD